jgi:misacylated tRNA(Ala) deacylase
LQQPSSRPSPTIRLYWQDDHCFEADALVIAAEHDAVAFDQTCFYPGGGGQPPDQGTVEFTAGGVLNITSVRTGADHILWHVLDSSPPAGVLGQRAKLALNRQRRIALMRHHTVLHVLNTIALRDYEGWITGVQIGTDYSRIDFKFDKFSPSLPPELEQKVNAVIGANLALKSYYLPEADFRERRDLLRTLEVQPPVVDGQVRVVAIDGFDAQACGGTHVSTTAEVGRFSIFRTENKGRINKRLYVRLDP